jgi:hypothetical protein
MPMAATRTTPVLSEAEHRHRAAAACPRCGYQLRGEIDRWRSSCPLEGTCTECGLDFAWPEVLSSTVRLPAWCVEGSGSWRTLPLRALRTAAVSLAPWIFWSRLRMTHRVSAGRLVAYVVMVTLITYLGFALTHASLARHTLVRGGPASLVDWRTPLNAALTPFSSQTGEKALFPSMLNSWLPGDSPLGLVRKCWLPEADALACAVATPLCIALAFLAIPVSRRQAKVRWRHILRISTYAAALMLLVAMALTIAQVRFAAFGGSIASMTSFPMSAFTFSDPSSIEPWGISRSLMMLLPVCVPGLLAWWWFAVRRYLRMEQAGAVALSVTAIGVLAPVCVALVLATA